MLGSWNAGNMACHQRRKLVMRPQTPNQVLSPPAEINLASLLKAARWSYQSWESLRESRESLRWGLQVKNRRGEHPTRAANIQITWLRKLRQSSRVLVWAYFSWLRSPRPNFCLPISTAGLSPQGTNNSGLCWGWFSREMFSRTRYWV